MGKPLISDAVMHGMYETMQQMRSAQREAGGGGGHTRSKHAALQAEPEALFAAMFSQLRRRDTLLTQDTRPLLPIAQAAYFPTDTPMTVHTCNGTVEECAAVAVGMALRAAERLRDTNGPTLLSGHPPRPVVLAMLNNPAPMKGVLQLIEQHDLPVLLIVGGEVESRADSQRRLQTTRVPFMPVDRSDAVAICRVMQECLLRARNGWGGAVIHAAPMPGSSDPLLLLRKHMEKRGLFAEAVQRRSPTKR